MGKMTKISGPKFIPHLGSMVEATTACSKNLFSGKNEASKIISEAEKNKGQTTFSQNSSCSQQISAGLLPSSTPKFMDKP